MNSELVGVEDQAESSTEKDATKSVNRTLQGILKINTERQSLKYNSTEYLCFLILADLDVTIYAFH